MDYSSFVGTLGIVIALSWLLAMWLGWRWTWFLGWLKGSVIMGLVFTGVLLGSIALDLQHWQKAMDGEAIAHVSVDRSSGPTPVITIKSRGTQDHELNINGDFLDLELQTLQWQGVFSSAGLSYRVAIAHSHFDAIENNLNWSDAGRSHNLPYPTSGVDLWKAFHGTACGRYMSGLVKAGKLRVNYIPLEDGALFAVVFRGGKLVLEPQNQAAVDSGSL
ncbi:MAG: hypothetical protein EP312_08025 [Gammaproteobacteria bacterium]|nr:MAG: hypothetical protein EP312_08025 [Gammaproteobacteria bacterium]